MRLFRLCFVVLLGSIAALSVSQTIFTQQQLENADGNDDNAIANDVNDQQFVVGKYEFGGSSSVKAYVWSRNGHMVILPRLATSGGYGTSFAKAIRNGGNATIVGQSRNTSGTYRAVKWTTSDEVNYACSDLQAAPFSWDGEALAINDSSTVVGWGRITSSSGPIHAFKRSSAGTLTDIYSGDTRNSKATGINNSGRICGFVDISTSNTNNKAYWYDSSAHNLPQNSGSPYDQSEAWAINNNHDVCGRVHSGGGWQACVWYWNGSSYNNPVVFGPVASNAQDINDARLIVGNENGHGFYYTGSAYYNINDLPRGGFSGGPHAGWIQSCTGLNNGDGRNLSISGYGVNNTSSHTLSVITRAADEGNIANQDLGAIGSVSIVGGTIPVHEGDSLTGRVDFLYNGNPDYLGQARDVYVTVSGPGCTIDGSGGTHYFHVNRNFASTQTFTIGTSTASIGSSIYLHVQVDSPSIEGFGYRPHDQIISVLRGNTRVFSVDRTAHYFEPVNMYANLAQNDTNMSAAIGGATLYFRANGVDFASGSTDGAGNCNAPVIIPQSFPLGTQTCNVRFDGDLFYNPSNTNITIDVQRAPTSLQVGNTSQRRGNLAHLTATLRRNYLSAPVSGEQIRFSVAGYGQVGQGTTDGNGNASYDWLVPTNATIGNRTITSDFNQTNYHESSSANGTLTIQNNAPVASNASLSVDEDTPLNASVSATDPDGDSLTYTKIADPQHGTLVINTNGSFTYTPNSNYNGQDTFTFKANDGNDDSNTATVTVAVSAVNDAPTAAAPPHLDANQCVAISLAGVSIADVDAGNGEVKVSLSVSSGALTLGQIAGLNFQVGDGTSDAAMTFTATLPNANSALASLSFVSMNAGQASFSLNVDDQGNTGSGGSLTADASAAIDVQIAEPVSFGPSGVSVTIGSFFQGNLAALASSDDVRYRFFDDADTLEGEIEVVGESTLACPAVEYRILVEARSTRPGLQEIVRAFNYTTSEFDDLASDEATLFDVQLEGVVTASVADYVGSSGAVKVRVYFVPFNDEVPGQDGWLLEVDQVRWTISP